MIGWRGGQLALLAIAAMSGVYARSALGPLQETMRVALSLTDNQMALLQGAALAAPTVVAAVPLGVLVDRYSRVRLILALAAINLLGSTLTGLARGFGPLLVARSLVGLAAGATVTAAFSLLADLYPAPLRGRANMTIVVSQVFGMSAAFALGGALLGRFATAADGWRWVMLGLTAPLLPVVLVSLGLREPLRTGVVVGKPAIRDIVGQLWRLRAVVAPLGAGIVMTEIAAGAVLVWGAPAFQRGFGLSPQSVGEVMAGALLMGGIAGPITGGVLADIGERSGGARRTLHLLSLLAILTGPAAAFALLPRLGQASVLLVAFMGLVNAIAVAGTTLFTIVIPNELRGLCMSVLAGACALLGFGLAPLTVSLLAGVLGGSATVGTALAVVGSANAVLGAVLFSLAARGLSA